MATVQPRPTSLKLDEGMRGRIKRLAESRRRTPHWLMTEAIREYVEREERREQLHEDALRAWQSYEATGQHVTMEEADAWLAQLESGKDVEPPECHG